MRNTRTINFKLNTCKVTKTVSIFYQRSPKRKKETSMRRVDHPVWFPWGENEPLWESFIRMENLTVETQKIMSMIHLSSNPILLIKHSRYSHSTRSKALLKFNFRTTISFKPYLKLLINRMKTLMADNDIIKLIFKT